VQRGLVGAADIHAGAAAHWFQAFEHFDVLGAVIVRGFAVIEKISQNCDSVVSGRWSVASGQKVRVRASWGVMVDQVCVFWEECCRQTGQAGHCPAVACFGDNAAMQDELCALVLAGRKRATASLALWYGAEREFLPKAGDLKVIVDGAGAPRCVIEILSVEERRFCDVDESFAAVEGEGDGSLDDWRREHHRFFAAELAAEGLGFSEEVSVVLERFRVVWAGG